MTTLTASRCRRLAPLVLTLALAPACSDDSKDGPPAGFAAGLAVISSDYKSTSLALVDPLDGNRVRVDCRTSGSTPSSASMALSGDVVLPTQPAANHALVVVDRGNAAVTWIDPTTCTPLRQLSVATGYAANPHDLVVVSSGKAYVTRYDRNPMPTADTGDFDEGEDLLVIDPSAPAVLGRVDLAGQSPSPTVQARPSRALLAQGKVFVTLEAVSADYKTSAEGRVVIVDPATDTVGAAVAITGLKGCQALAAAEGSKTVWVACGGSFTDADQAAGSALVALDAGVSPPVVKTVVPVSAFAGRPLDAAHLAVDADAAVYVATIGDGSGMPPDELWVYDVAAGKASKVVAAGGSFQFGGLVVEPLGRTLFLADGNAQTPRVRLFGLTIPVMPSDGGFAVPGTLPPRELGWY